MAVYLAQLERLRSMRIRAIAPGHGEVIEEPMAKVDEYLTHRRAREAQILTALAEAGTATAAELVATCYADVAAELHPVATRSVWAHLRKLADEGSVTTTDRDDVESSWSAA
jgi:hydroxyacylglutathione hydrolase